MGYRKDFENQVTFTQSVPSGGSWQQIGSVLNIPKDFISILYLRVRFTTWTGVLYVKVLEYDQSTLIRTTILPLNGAYSKVTNLVIPVGLLENTTHCTIESRNAGGDTSTTFIINIHGIAKRQHNNDVIHTSVQPPMIPSNGGLAVVYNFTGLSTGIYRLSYYNCMLDANMIGGSTPSHLYFERSTTSIKRNNIAVTGVLIEQGGLQPSTSSEYQVSSFSVFNTYIKILSENSNISIEWLPPTSVSPNLILAGGDYSNLTLTKLATGNLDNQGEAF